MDPKTIICPPLHIKLGLIKQLTKTLPDGYAVARWNQMFPSISIAKIKKGILIGPDVDKILHDREFFRLYQLTTNLHWLYSKMLLKDFLKIEDPNYKHLVQTLIESYRINGAREMHKYENIHEITFTRIFGGIPFNTQNVSMTQRIKSELRNEDRRSCQPSCVFYLLVILLRLSKYFLIILYMQYASNDSLSRKNNFDQEIFSTGSIVTAAKQS